MREGGRRERENVRDGEVRMTHGEKRPCICKLTNVYSIYIQGCRVGETFSMHF